MIPKVVITSYHHFIGKNGNNRYLDVYFYRNPEVEGFDVPVKSNELTTDWNPLQINAYPDKVAYIEKLKKEGAILHEEIRKGFEKK